MAKVLNWVFFGRLFLTLHLKVDQKKCVRLLNSSLQPDQEYTKTKESFCKNDWLQKKRNLLQKYFCREDQACQRLWGSCSRRWWRRPPGCQTSTTDLTFSGAISLLSSKINYCNSLFIFRRITHSFKEGEEFRKDEDIHKWEQYLKMTFECGLIYESIYMNNEYQVFGLSTDQLGHAKAPGLYWGVLQSKVHEPPK